MPPPFAAAAAPPSPFRPRSLQRKSSSSNATAGPTAPQPIANQGLWRRWTWQSYWIARASGRKFVYSGGATFLDGAPLNNASGQGLIDCSTYIHLVLRGIPYQKSPYVNTNANAAYNPSDLLTNTAYTWADDHIRSSKTLGATPPIWPPIIGPPDGRLRTLLCGNPEI